MIQSLNVIDKKIENYQKSLTMAQAMVKANNIALKALYDCRSALIAELGISGIDKEDTGVSDG